MELKELYKKLRKYEIQIRKAVRSHMQGDFHSIFKGSGLDFDDVRAYQYGDDIRRIDWNVTAKGHGTYIKTFKEEKEQTVFFLLDVSGSQEIGSAGNRKLDVGKEICGVLTLSSIKEDSQVGLICFSDRNEKYVKPGKDIRHAFEMLKALFTLQPVSTRTSLSKAILFTMQIIKRRSVIILVSDFVDENYYHNLKALAKKHDLVAIHLTDRSETALPGLGITPLYDKEAKKTVWVNTSSSAFKRSLKKTYHENKQELEKICKQYDINYLEVNTNEDYLPKLIKLFKIRNRSLKAG
jgi:uncharacterized protein (DUF58 family)